MPKPIPPSRIKSDSIVNISDSSESIIVELSSEETTCSDEQSKSSSSPGMKSTTKKSAQREAYKANPSLSTSYTAETLRSDKRSKSSSPPVIKANTKKSAQREAYKANPSSSTSYTAMNRDLEKSFKTEIEIARNNINRKKDNWTKFTKSIDKNGVLSLTGVHSVEVQDLAEWLNSSAGAKVTNLTISCEINAWSEMNYEAAKSLAKIIQTNTTITSLGISIVYLDDQIAQYFAEAIKANPETKITTLDFKINKIGAEGTKALAEALKTNTKLIPLDLGCNKISDEGTKALAEVLKTNRTLTTLHLEHNKIGPDTDLS